ncbi:MAG: hypothetical protein JJU42_16265, partial [Rhodobacteraceae bacterium]|nr:hypothetical protein [Paracoccaceae bacterium]
MSDAERAYELAQQEIARVKAAGEDKLRLTGRTFYALDRLPPELAELTKLQELWIVKTQINDLSPLQTLTSLQRLRLDSKQVSDLAPLQGLTSLQTLR